MENEKQPTNYKCLGHYEGKAFETNSSKDFWIYGAITLVAILILVMVFKWIGKYML